MDANIIDVYTNYTIKNATKYTELFVSKIYKGKPPWKITYIRMNVAKIIVDYYRDFLSIKKLDYSAFLDIKTFVDSQKIDKPSLKKILMLCIKYFSSIETLRCDSALFEEIKTLSGSILVAVELNSRANSIVTTQVSFRDAEDEIIDEYADVLETEVIDILKQSETDFRVIYNEALKVGNNLHKHYERGGFEMKFIKLKNYLDNTRWYEITNSYSFTKLELTTDKKINEIVGKNSIREAITYIILDKLSYLILKLIMHKQQVPKFVVDVPMDMLKLKKNIKKLNSIFLSKIIREHIVLRIDYLQLKKYGINIQTLKKHQINVIVKNLPTNYDEELLGLVNYIEVTPIQFGEAEIKETIKNAKIQLMLDYEHEEDVTKYQPILAKNMKTIRRMSQEVVFGDATE